MFDIVSSVSLSSSSQAIGLANAKQVLSFHRLYFQCVQSWTKHGLKDCLTLLREVSEGWQDHVSVCSWAAEQRLTKSWTNTTDCNRLKQTCRATFVHVCVLVPGDIVGSVSGRTAAEIHFRICIWPKDLHRSTQILQVFLRNRGGRWQQKATIVSRGADRDLSMFSAKFT